MLDKFSQYLKFLIIKNIFIFAFLNFINIILKYLKIRFYLYSKISSRYTVFFHKIYIFLFLFII